MKIYRTVFTDAHEGCLLFWYSSRAAAEQKLRDLREELGEPQGLALVEQVDIPTDRTRLLRWLNDNFSTDNG